MIRPPRRGDQSFIAATWSRSMLSTHASQRHGSMRTGEKIGTHLDRVFDRSDTRALVAVHPEQQDYIHGWVVYVDAAKVPIVHYLYVRAHDASGAPLRGRGIASLLLRQIGVHRETGVVCTSSGPSSESMRGWYRASVYVPLAEFMSTKEKP